jgi:hypothetical protein
MSSSPILTAATFPRNAYEISYNRNWVANGSILVASVTATGDLIFTLTLDGMDGTGLAAPATSTATVNIPTLLYRATSGTYGGTYQRTATFSPTATERISTVTRQALLSGAISSNFQPSELLWTELLNSIHVLLSSSTIAWNTFVTNDTVETMAPIPEERETHLWIPTSWQGGF